MMHSHENDVDELPANACWELLGDDGVGRLAVRLVPGSVTGRRFPIADPGTWRTPLSDARRSPEE